MLMLVLQVAGVLDLDWRMIVLRKRRPGTFWPHIPAWVGGGGVHILRGKAFSRAAPGLARRSESAARGRPKATEPGIRLRKDGWRHLCLNPESSAWCRRYGRARGRRGFCSAEAHKEEVTHTSTPTSYTPDLSRSPMLAPGSWDQGYRC